MTGIIKQRIPMIKIIRQYGKDSKLTKEQILHFSKGGKFKAIYKPKVTHDVSASNLKYYEKEVVIYQNIINAPIASVPNYVGQHAFNSGLIQGWFPEEDVHDLKIINEYIDEPRPLPAYMYMLVYTEQEQLESNFGKGYEDVPLPLIVGREYHDEMDEYVKDLSSLPATAIYKCVWTGCEKWSELKWKKI